VNAPVDAAELTRLLGPGSPWQPIEIVAVTGSTNDDLMARGGAQHGLVRIAGFQTAGRGRFDRVWQAAPGAGVAVSVMVRPSSPVTHWGWLSLLTGMAAADGLRGIGRQNGSDAGRVSLKWPNDVLIDDAKVCGILAQTDGEIVVLGWGLNIAMTRGELPVPTATSLALAGWPVDSTAVVAAVLQRLQHYYTLWEGGSDLTVDYLALSSTIGRRVRVESLHSVIEGEAVGIDDAGALLVSADSAGVVAVDAGDVVHLRKGR